MTKIRIFLTDDHALFRHGIKTLIGSDPGMEVVGEASNAIHPIAENAEVKPDVVPMDIGMPGLSSFEATRQIRKNRPETHVLFLTIYGDEDYLVESIESAGSGYLVKKNSPAPQLLSAIRACLAWRQPPQPSNGVSTGGRFPFPRKVD
jgi:two-component system response regulator NreC